jgi:hypothetical protein
MTNFYYTSNVSSLISNSASFAELVEALKRAKSCPARALASPQLKHRQKSCLVPAGGRGRLLEIHKKRSVSHLSGNTQKTFCLLCRQCLRETNRPSTASLNLPTSPTARPITPTFDDYVPSPAHDNVRLAPPYTAPQPQPFSTLDMHPHPSHLAPPQPPHLASPQFPAPPNLKPARPDSPPPASRKPQGAIHTDAASAESLEAHDAKETETKKPRHQEAHDEHALTRHTSGSQGYLSRPMNWDSMTRTARKHWKTKQAKHKNLLHK